jgi:hypothetical protein
MSAKNIAAVHKAQPGRGVEQAARKLGELSQQEGAAAAAYRPKTATKTNTQSSTAFILLRKQETQGAGQYPPAPHPSSFVPFSFLTSSDFPAF